MRLGKSEDENWQGSGPICLPQIPLDIGPMSVELQLQDSLESDLNMNHIFGLCWVGQLA